MFIQHGSDSSDALNYCIQVLHRRLGARNVLLKEQYGGLVAKLIGFGPNREDKYGGQVTYK